MTESHTQFALVAGGSGGIGSAVVRRLAHDGYDIGICYRSKTERAEQVASAVAATGRRVRVYQADLRERSEAARTVKAAVADFGRIDALVYCAGPYLPQRWVTEFSPGQLESMILDDTFAFWGIVQEALTHLRTTRGCVVTLSTPAIRRHARKDLGSTAPKAAIEAMVRAVASEEGRYGVRANAIGVGLVDGGMMHDLFADGELDENFLEVSRQAIALGRMCSPDDIAQGVAFLASRERAGYITGQSLDVDGGYAL